MERVSLRKQQEILTYDATTRVLVWSSRRFLGGAFWHLEASTQVERELAVLPTVLVLLDPDGSDDWQRRSCCICLRQERRIAFTALGRQRRSECSIDYRQPDGCPTKDKSMRANHDGQRTGASRHAEWRCRRPGRLAPVADIGVG